MRRIFQQTAARAGDQGSKEAVLIFASRENDDVQAGQLRLESPHAFHAVHGRQIDVEQHHVRLEAGQFVERGLGVRAMTHHAAGCLGVNQLGQFGAQRVIVVHNGRTDGFWLEGRFFEPDGFRRHGFEGLVHFRVAQPSGS